MVFYCFITSLTIMLACFVESRAALRLYGGGGHFSARTVTRRRAFNYVCLTGIFLVLSGLAALRTDVGNDYWKYIDTFHELYVGTDSAYVVTEAGFNFVVKAVYTLSGFENYLLVFALFGAATAFFFLKAMYDQSVSFGISFALFMLLGLYFRTFTTVRYYFALALALYSIRYLRRGDYIKFVLLILFGALFHKSVLIVLLLYPLAGIKWNRWLIGAGAAAAAALFVFRAPLLEAALLVYPTYRDTVYLKLDVGLWANASGIIRCLFVFALAFWCHGESEGAVREKNVFYLKLNLLGLLLYTCGSFLPLVSRLAYYLVTPQILLIPGLLSGISDRKKKRLAMAVTAVFCLCYFAYFLAEAPGGGIRVLPYQSWIFTTKEWINGSEFF